MKSENAVVEWTHYDALNCTRLHNARERRKRRPARANPTWNYAVLIAIARMRRRHQRIARPPERPSTDDYRKLVQRTAELGKVPHRAWALKEYQMLERMNAQRFTMTKPAIHGSAWAYCCDERVRRAKQKDFYVRPGLPQGRYQPHVGPRRLSGEDYAWDLTARAMVAKMLETSCRQRGGNFEVAEQTGN